MRIYIYRHVYLYVCMCMCVLDLDICTYAYMYACMHACKYKYIHTYKERGYIQTSCVHMCMVTLASVCIYM